MLLLLQIFLLSLSPAVGSYVKCRADRFDTATQGLRSRCDQCGVELGWPDILPIWSWLRLGGRSRCCDRPLRVSLLLAEIAALGISLWALATTEGAIAIASVLLGWTLLGLALVDLRHFRLPDLGTLPLICAGLALSATGLTGPLLWHALGAILGFAVLYAIRAGYRHWRGVEGLGLGDAKLLAAAGAWTGATALPGILLIACITGLLHALLIASSSPGLRRDLAIPFGPALCFGFWVTWLHGPIAFAIR